MDKKLMFWQEAVGVVVKVEGNVAHFGNHDTVVIDDESFLEKLGRYMGKRVAIIRTDINGSEYILREG
jgi:hypothetical protein